MELDKPEADPQAWRKHPKFLAIKGISREECIHGTGQMERIKSILSNSSLDIKKSHSLGADAPLGYGKYANKTMREIKESDLSYYLWMLENVPKFAALAKKLNLS